MDMFALGLGWNSDLLQLQSNLAKQFSPEIRFNTPDNFHVTLVAMDGDFPWEFFWEVDLPRTVPFTFSTTGLELLDTPQGDKAVILRIDPPDELKELQARLYGWALTSGLDVGEFYEPGGWIPHITLGRTESDLSLPQVSELVFAANEFFLVEEITFNDFWSFELSNMRQFSLLSSPIVSQVRSVTPMAEAGTELTRYTFVGFPFSGPMKGGPQGLDLHKTYFDGQTDLGWEDHIMPVYVDHAMSPELGRAIVGRAQLGEITDEGRLIEIFVEKANRYHDFLAELDELGLLRGSGQAIASCYTVDKASRHIDTFHPAEYSFTVEPSNVNAAPARHIQIDSLLRKHGIAVKEDNMDEFARLLPQYPEEDQEVLRSFDDETQAAFVAEEDEERRAAMIQEHRTASESAAEEEAPEAEEVARSADVVNEMFEANTPEPVVEDPTRALTEEVTELRGQLAEISRQLVDIREGNLALAEQLSRTLPRLAAESASMSQVERDVLMRQSPAPKDPLPIRSNGLASAGLGSPGGSR